MNSIFKYGSITAIPLYNCSGRSPEEWSKRDGVRRPIAGALEFTYGTVITLLYIPIIAVLFEKEHFKMSCFKIMIFLAIVDMLAIWVSSIITGFLAFRGAVYCTYPNLIYITGMIGLGLWCCSCLTAMILVLNRLIDLTKSRLGNFLFKGKRTYLVLSFSFCYFLYFMLFTTPPVFTSKYHTWFFDPLIFENRTKEYANISHGLNNILVVSLTCLLYTSFCFVLGNKIHGAKISSQTLSKSQKISIQIFCQSAMICAVNQIASIVYVIMNFINVPFWLIIIGDVTWQFGHGAPALIYICFNKTIRNGVLKTFHLKKKTTMVVSNDLLSTIFTRTN